MASSVAAEIDRYYRAIEQAARDPELQDAVTAVVDQRDAELAALADPTDRSDKEEQTRESKRF